MYPITVILFDIVLISTHVTPEVYSPAHPQERETQVKLEYAWYTQSTMQIIVEKEIVWEKGWNEIFWLKTCSANAPSAQWLAALLS